MTPLKVRENNDSLKKIGNLSYSAKYILMHLCNMIGPLEDTVEGVTLHSLTGITGLSKSSLIDCIKELEDANHLRKKRDYFHGKGRGINSYILCNKICVMGLMNFQHIIESNKFKTINPIQRFILMLLLNRANVFGIVENYSLREFSRDSSISINALKKNLLEMEKSRYILKYCSGGNLSIFAKKVKSSFFLNIIENYDSDIPLIGLSRVKKNRDVMPYLFRFEESLIGDEFNSVTHYIKKLSQQNRTFFFEHLTNLVDKHIGMLRAHILHYSHVPIVKEIPSRMNKDIFNILKAECITEQNKAKLIKEILERPVFERVIDSFESEFSDQKTKNSTEVEVINALKKQLRLVIFCNVYHQLAWPVPRDKFYLFVTLNSFIKTRQGLPVKEVISMSAPKVDEFEYYEISNRRGNPAYF